MRIAVDATVLVLPELRGIGSYLTEILAVWPEPGDTFLLLSPRPIPAGRCNSPAALRTVLAPETRGSRFHVWRWLTLPRALRQLAPDLLWCPANHAAPVRGAPQVVSIHDTLLQELVCHDTLLERLYTNRITPWWVRRYASGIVTGSEFSRRRIEAVFHCDPRSMRVIPDGATRPVSPFSDKERARAHLRSKGLVDRPYVLALGAESPWKNTDGVLRAFAHLGRMNKEVAFVVAGLQQRVADRFAALGHALGLGERLRLPGFVAPQDRDALYQGAAVFVYPSLFEGFGLPVLEAMALDTPVVASNAASIPEVAGRAARLVDAANPEALARAILDVLDRPRLAQALVAAGRINIKRFQWQTSARSHRDFFMENTRHETHPRR